MCKMGDGTCKTCKYWKDYENSWYTFEGMHTCQSPRVHYGYGFRPGSPEILASDIIVEADEGWGMWAAPCFGCVNWEAIDEL